MELRRYVQHILRGEYDRAGVEAPSMALGDLDQLGETVHETAQRPHPFPPSPHLVVGNGARMVPRRPRSACGAECTSRGVVAYQWVADEPLRELLIAHGLSHAILHDTRGDSNDADAWVLTGAIIIPESRMELARAHPELLVRRAPPWFITGRLIESRARKAVGL